MMSQISEAGLVLVLLSVLIALGTGRISTLIKIAAFQRGRDCLVA